MNKTDFLYVYAPHIDSRWQDTGDGELFMDMKTNVFAVFDGPTSASELSRLTKVLQYKNNASGYGEILMVIENPNCQNLNLESERMADLAKSCYK